MLRKFFAISAFAALLATGALAQATLQEPSGDPGGDAGPAQQVEPAPGVEEVDIEPNEIGDDTVEVAPAMPPGGGAAGTGVATGSWEIEPGSTGVDPEGVSAEDLMDAEVTTVEGEELGTVDDVRVSAEGKIEGVAVTFGGFLGFGTNRVLIEAGEFDIVEDDAGEMRLRTALTPEDIEARPDYE